MKDLYAKNYKTLIKEIEHSTKRWKDITGTWFQRINVIKMSILPKVIYYDSCQITHESFYIIRMNSPRNYKDTEFVKEILREKMLKE